MLVDGRSIAEEIFQNLAKELAQMDTTPCLTVFTCAPNFETQKFLAIKKRKADQVGITLSVIELLPDSTTEDVVAAIETAVSDSNGIIPQFPFPSHIDTEMVVAAIPPSYDVDALNPATTDVHSPVVGALIAIIDAHDVLVKEKNIVVIGAGKLVGQPAAAWFQEAGAYVSVLDRDTKDIATYTNDADIIVLGAGQPGFLKPGHIKEGVVILDAGTSEAWGELKGDADPTCAEKASLFTPVPGGIGPITVAVLFRNLVDLMEKGK